MLLSTLVKPLKGQHTSQLVLSGALLTMDSITNMLDLTLPNIREDFIGDSAVKANSEVIVYNLLVMLYCYTEVNPAVEDYFELFISVGQKEFF